jgi:hypothetical protein
MGEIRNVYMLVRPNGRDHLGELSVGSRVL